MWNNQVLENSQSSVELSDVSWSTSNTLKALSAVTEDFITLAFAANAGNYVKVLFEMEQLIEYHKYVNQSLPVNFLRLLLDMTNFQYVNVFGVTNIDLYGVVANITTPDFDMLGDLRMVYYARGINFFKNIVECIGSFLALMLLNLICFGIIAVIPVKLFQSYRKHLWDRKLNTLNDSLETMVMPVIFFGVQQLSAVLYQGKYVYIYLLLVLMWAFMIAYPFVVAAFIHRHRND